MSKIKKVFHPSYYIKEYIDELEMTQDEFAKRLGISGKQVSLLLSEEANITPDIAFKLSTLIGTSAEFWLNLQSKYDVYKISIEKEVLLKEEKKIYKMIDKKFLKQIEIIDEDDNEEIGIEKVRKTALVSSLTLLAENDIYCYYRTSINKKETIDNLVCKNLWVSIATQLAKQEETKAFNEKEILNNVNYLRSMTRDEPENFLPKIKKILNDNGVAIVILPSLKNSNINGVVKWLNKEKAMMALNTRCAYNDQFWFSFFHELKHVLQKSKRKIIIGEEEKNSNLDIILEYEADLFARETLIPTEKLNKLINYDEVSIKEFADSIDIHPGIVVGRLQKDGKINYSHLNYLKQKYDIV